MKVLIFTQYFWPETFGINALAKKLRDQGMEVTVMTGKPNYPEGKVFAGHSAWGTARDAYDGIEVLRLPLSPRGKQSSLRLLLNYLSFIVAGTVIGPWMLRHRSFDAVFVYAPSPLLQALPAIWLARLKRAPMALWVQDLWPESLSATGFIKNQRVLGLVAHVVRFIYRHTDRVLVPSEAFRAPILALTKGAADIHYYPNAWVEEPVSDTLADVDALANNIASGFSVVFAGNLGVAQSLDTILDAAERLQNSGSQARFFLIGSGSLSSWLNDEIQRRNLRNVVLPGRFPPAAMPRLYEAASALLVSLRDEPIFAYTIPSKVQGYLAAGRPVIASLNGEGSRVVTEAGAGIACAAGDAQALAEAVQVLTQMDSDSRTKMGENARRYALAHFSLDRLASDLVGQFEELLATHAIQKQEKSR
ncbi:glycosyltransferase family 4 protein [Hydrogenophaga sp. 2FB]|uniref:glycosyltransferase family 4 protein n=1 Tax=Hydrogenophaga sp. 2FB TaxID=2502187 RepID=UPI0010F5369C|nr:glycosyltransferase family 4 protein [Hydrogenophaga sp. 2FB]